VKTTAVITDALLDDAKQLAAEEGVTLDELIEVGLRRVISSHRTHAPFQVRDASIGGQGTQPGIDAASREQMGHLLYDAQAE
jgi:hypothetical protein